MLMAFNLLSLGVDQVAIRKIATGYDVKRMLSVYLCHVLISGTLFYIILMCCVTRPDLYLLLLVIGGGKLMIYFSTPFKQVVSGLEKFGVLAGMLVVSNVVRSIGLAVLAWLHYLNLRETMLIFVFGDFTELIFCIWLFRRHTRIPIIVKWYKTNYGQLLKEAMPQMGVVIITAAMSRLDWIFIGLLVSAAKLGEYSFAYKVFEMATLPLLAIAPLLLPWFTRIFKSGDPQAPPFKLLIRIELVVAVLTGLILNILWTPVVDAITAGKYGAVNVNTIFLLSLCIPFLYLNNFLWTIYFAQGRMRMILTGFMITFSVNAGLDIWLIPVFNKEGAAIAFLVACMVQTFFYLRQNKQDGLRVIWQNLLFCMGSALISGVVSVNCFSGYYIQLAVSITMCMGLLILTRQIRFKDRFRLAAVFTS